MKRIISVITCTMLAACSCSDNQWEEVDNVTFDETVYEDQAPVIEPAPVAPAPAPVVVKPEPIYVPAPQPVYDCPCAEVAQPCYQPTCMQPCGCQPMPMPQPKVTTTKKIITTTTTMEEPCGKDVCEPVVTTHEESTKKLYMDYYDKDFNKIWGREFDYKSSDFDIYSTPMDYTASQLSVVIDNDLYLIDLTTGENVIEPVLVGNKIAISMLSDRILLIGNDNKDAIMMVDYKGNVIKKMNADTTMDSIYSADMQIVNNRIVIILSGSKELDYYTEYSNTEYLKKYIVLDSEGNVELSTKDTNEY